MPRRFCAQPRPQCRLDRRRGARNAVARLERPLRGRDRVAVVARCDGGAAHGAVASRGRRRGRACNLERAIALVARRAADGDGVRRPGRRRPGPAAATATTDATLAALDHERERIQSLEAGIRPTARRFGSDSRNVVALQARLREAEGERYANGLVYALSGGLAFCSR